MTHTNQRTIRLTVAQATVEFLAAQWSERDGVRQRLFAGCFGIFGHGNVAGIGQALLQHESHALEAGSRPGLPYVLARNEQAMVHTSVAYARQKDRLQTWVCTASVGPGSTNMVTGAALATINRLPVLLLASDTFATRRSAPVLQELEAPYAGDVTVNDAFRPVSRYFDRVWRAAGADRPCGDRGGDAGAPPGRPGGGARLAGGAVRGADLARGPATGRAGPDRGGRPAGP
jgi:3D-(3,5/4)-trihydroxycyclohexane-1,2-dione acylhydrolase (decyclizing)